jgi:hypothetical protein
MTMRLSLRVDKKRNRGIQFAIVACEDTIPFARRQTFRKGWATKMSAICQNLTKSTYGPATAIGRIPEFADNFDTHGYKPDFGIFLPILLRRSYPNSVSKV